MYVHHSSKYLWPPVISFKIPNVWRKHAARLSSTIEWASFPCLLHCRSHRLGPTPELTAWKFWSTFALCGSYLSYLQNLAQSATISHNLPDFVDFDCVITYVSPFGQFWRIAVMIYCRAAWQSSQLETFFINFSLSLKRVCRIKWDIDCGAT